MEKVSCVLSILAVLGTVFTYIYHDRKIKMQEKILNDYQLKKIKMEEIDNQKAQIRGNIIKGNKGARTLAIFNSGKATAYNISLEVLSELDGIFFFEFEPYEMLNPEEKTEICFSLSMAHTSTLKVKYIWKDSFKEINEYIQVLSL